MKIPLSIATELGCPTPKKMVFTSPAKAKQWLRTRRMNHGFKAKLYPYVCRCGSYHLSHYPPTKIKKRDDADSERDAMEQAGTRAAG